jgi:glucose/arabinose dehydrogenase
MNPSSAGAFRASVLSLSIVAASLTVTLNAADSADIIQTKSGAVKVERLAQLEFPWGMTFLPDGRLLLTEKPGRLRTYSDGKLSEPIKGLPKFTYRGQGGLLDVEIDPDFAKNHLVYLFFTEAAESQPENAQVLPDPRLGKSPDKTDTVLKGGAVARGKLENDELREVSVIWRQVPKTIGLGHYGGRLVFAADGKLFITSGERQRFEPAQDLKVNLGKIVRINPDGSIPEDNPFVNKPDALPDIWSFGHRNPLGATLHPSSKQLWINEMGPAGGDEINIIERGKNYGWPTVSNGDNYDGTPIPRHSTHPEFAPPLWSWNPAISPSGLIFYQGSLFRNWRGNILLGGLSSKSLILLSLDGDRVKGEERISMNRRIRDVIEARDGAVLLLTDAKNGELLRLSPSEGPTPTGK